MDTFEKDVKAYVDLLYINSTFNISHITLGELYTKYGRKETDAAVEQELENRRVK